MAIRSWQYDHGNMSVYIMAIQENYIMAIEKFTGNFEKEDLGCTIVVNETIQNITDPAVLGIYCYLLTKPPGWNIQAKELMNHFKMSKDKCYRLLTALLDLKLLSRTQQRHAGHFLTYNYKLHLKPYNLPHPENQETENQETYKTNILPLKNKDNNTTTSEFENSPITAIKNKKNKNPKNQLMGLIDIYREVFPDNPQPHRSLISTSLEKVLRTLIKRWPEADPKQRELTPEGFKLYLTALKELAPKFALREYELPSGIKKKNGLETFARWNTLVKFLEGAYS